MTTTEKMHHIYTDRCAMTDWINAAGSPAQMLRRATHCLDVARDPQHRFGLSSRDTAPVVATCETAIENIHLAVAHMVEAVLTRRAEGLTWGECPFAFAFGFGSMDVSLLGLSGCGIDPELAERLASGV